ncbi:class I SAM-dependent methyltransferase [Candidatus Poribacteria bacterium]|nr:class I SAM-dependent methyltransferase [Candidatus Poribacteria bacterium]
MALREEKMDRYQPIIDELEKLRGEFQKVLDVGCGKGELLLEIAERFGVNCTGVDKKSSKISSARSAAIRKGLGSRLSFQAQKAEEIDLEDESFDVVVSAFTVHELDDQLRGIKEIYRVLKKGGTFICLDWGKGARVVPWQHPLSLEEMKELCEKANFKEVSVRPLDGKRLLCVARR